MDKQDIKILDKKIEKGQELYLIHKLGEHKLTAKWIQKLELVKQAKHYKDILEKYDKELDLRCKRLKNINTNLAKNRRKKQQQDSSSSRSSSSDQKNRRRGRPRLHHQQQIFQKAKEQINEIVNNKTVPAQEFILFINTPAKLQSNWVFGDKLKRIKQKVAGEGLYSVLWEDGTSTVVKEKQIIERDPKIFCQFWQRRLGLSRFVRISQNTKNEMQVEDQQ